MNIEERKKDLNNILDYRCSKIDTTFSAGQFSTANDNNFIFKSTSTISLCFPISIHNGHTDDSFLSINWTHILEANFKSLA